MASYWMNLEVHSELVLSTANIAYHGTAAAGTIMVHIWIRQFINCRFVHVSGLAPDSVQLRHEQNTQNFNQCLAFQVVRIIFLLPASFLQWAPSGFLGTVNSSVCFLTFYTFYSLYISCCPGLSYGLNIFFNLCNFSGLTTAKNKGSNVVAPMRQYPRGDKAIQPPPRLVAPQLHQHLPVVASPLVDWELERMAMSFKGDLQPKEVVLDPRVFYERPSDTGREKLKTKSLSDFDTV